MVIDTERYGCLVENKFVEIQSGDALQRIIVVDNGSKSTNKVNGIIDERPRV